MTHPIIKHYESEKYKNNKYIELLTNLKVGDIVQVIQNSKTNKKQSFTGICIAIYKKGLLSSILLRNHLAGEAIEIQFYIFSNNISDIKLIKQNKPQIKYRRAKLYYLRNKTPKESTITI